MRSVALRSGCILLISLVIASCGDNPEEIETWPDGAEYYLGTPYSSDTALAWSPYGSVLLFSSSYYGDPDVFGYNGQGDPSARTSTSYDESTGPYGCWHADSGRIVYSATKEDDTTEIRWIPGNSTQVNVVLDDSLPHRHPSWSPEGDSLVFSTLLDGSWKLCTAELADTLQWSVIYEEPSADCLRPSYAPEGGWILFEMRYDSSSVDIWRVRPDGSGAEPLVESSASVDFHPCWGPYAGWFAFSSNRNGHFQIWVGSVLVDTLIMVTDDEGVDLYPAWNPSQGAIAFSSDRLGGDGNFDIFFIEEPSLPR